MALSEESSPKESSPEEVILQWYYAKNPRRHLDLSCWEITELPDMPDEVEWLDISNTCIKHLKGLPKNLKILYCKGCEDLETIEFPLPSNLTFINIYACCNLKIYDYPKNIKVKSAAFKYIRHFQELKESDHFAVAKRRVIEWIQENTNKRHKSVLDLSELQFEELPEIPDVVQSLKVNFNRKLKSLQGLPSGLKRLECSGYRQKEFKDLPPTLEYLKCDGAHIEILDELPDTIKKIDCSYSRIKTIKTLPRELKELDAHVSDCLKELCDFPPNIRKISLYDTNIHIVPILPETVTSIDISVNYNIKSIPNLPSKLKVLSASIAGIKEFPLLPDGLLYLDIVRLKQLNNNSIPNSIRYFDSVDLKLEDPTFR